MGEHDVLLVEYIHDDILNNVPTLIIGRKFKKYDAEELINSIEGEEAIQIYNKLIGKENEK